MEELREICGIVQEEAHEEAIIKWGLVSMKAWRMEIRVTVIATGIGKRAEMERPAWTQSTQPPEDLEIPHHPADFGAAPEPRGAAGAASGSWPIWGWWAPSGTSSTRTSSMRKASWTSRLS